MLLALRGRSFAVVSLELHGQPLIVSRIAKQRLQIVIIFINIDNKYPRV